MRRVTQVCTLHYQSTLDKMYIIKPAFIIRAAWKIMKGWMDPDTASKIEMLPGDETHKLFEKIDPSQVEKKIWRDFA